MIFISIAFLQQEILSKMSKTHEQARVREIQKKNKHFKKYTKKLIENMTKEEGLPKCPRTEMANTST